MQEQLDEALECCRGESRIKARGVRLRPFIPDWLPYMYLLPSFFVSFSPYLSPQHLPLSPLFIHRTIAAAATAADTDANARELQQVAKLFLHNAVSSVAVFDSSKVCLDIELCLISNGNKWVDVKTSMCDRSRKFLSLKSPFTYA